MGLYEFLLLIPLTGILYGLRRAKPFEDFHLVVVLLLYTPLRFFLDFLRAFEKRYWGLTPGQYFSIGFFMLAVFLGVRGLATLRTEPPGNEL